MKKLLVLVLTLTLLMLCSCAVEEKPVIDEEIFVADSDVGLVKDDIEIIETENGKFGAKIHYSEVLEPIYDSIEIYDRFFLVKEGDTFKTFEFTGRQIGYDYSRFVENEFESEIVPYLGIVSEGTMKILVQYENGEINGRREQKFEEVPAERYYLINDEGMPFFDIPLENYEIMTEADEPGKLFVYGTANGNRYEGWSKINGSERLVWMEETKPETFVDEFGYEHTGFYANWYGGYMQHGLNINGEVFLEPVYNGLTVPFEDRIILWYGMFMQGNESGYCKMIDLDKNVLTEECNRIDFIELEDGYYVGLEYSAGENSEYPIFDRNSIPRFKGIWFIDKDGKAISRTIGLIQDKNGFEYEGYIVVKEAITSINDVITVLDENGEEMKIAIKDYAFKP